MFAIYPPNNANLDNFFPKKCNIEKFSTSESENYGEVFHNFFADQGRNNFLGRIFTYAPPPTIMEKIK